MITIKRQLKKRATGNPKGTFTRRAVRVIEIEGLIDPCGGPTHLHGRGRESAERSGNAPKV